MSIVLITGCSSGFGKLTALTFARHGDGVFATVRNPAAAAELRQAAERAGVTVEVLDLDVTKSRSVDDGVAHVLARTDRIDILVNNAGVGVRGPAVEEFDDAEIARVFDTNVFGLLRVTRAVLPCMRAQASGTIVNISSLAGRVVAPFNGVYAASKHAVEALSDALFWELHPFGIRVVLVEPGFFATNIQQNQVPVRRATPDSPYRPFDARFAAALGRSLASASRGDPQLVADVIVDVAKAPQPRRRYLVGADAESLGALQRQLSDDDFERALRKALDYWD